MKKQFDEEIEEWSREAANKIAFQFDANAWTKMEKKLDEEKRKRPVLILFFNSILQYKKIFLVVTAILLVSGYLLFKKHTKNRNEPSFTTSLENNNTNARLKTNEDKNDIKDKITISSPIQNDLEIENKIMDVVVLPKKKELLYNATLNSISTKEKTTKPSFFVSKKKGKTENKKMKNDIFGTNTLPAKNHEISLMESAKEDLTKEDNTDNELSKQDTGVSSTLIIEKSEKEIAIKTNIKDTSVTRPVLATVQKEAKRNNQKNRFWKNLSFSGQISGEINTVNFKEKNSITANFGFSINYNVGKKLVASLAFIKGNKIYSTDKKGYKAPLEPYYATIDTLSISGKCNIIELPINIKYFIVGNSKSSLFVGAGLNSYIMEREDYKISYKYYGIPREKEYNYQKENKHLFSNLNLSIGYQYWYGKKMAFSVEPYIKLPIKGVGQGQINLTSIGSSLGILYKPW